MNENTDPKREFLRHVVATLAYRGGKAVRGAPPSFASFVPSSGRNTPLVILAHIGDLLDWALRISKGDSTWSSAPPQPWEREVERFYSSLAALDAYLGSSEPISSTPEKLYQGPLADAMTHVGQIAALRRMAGCPMKGENYFMADIKAGRVGPEQLPPRREFD
jgi:hypothetical protein